MPGGTPEAPRQSSRITQPSFKARQIQFGEAEGAGTAEYAFSAGFDDIIVAAISNMANDPCSLAKARSRSDWPQWRAAMDKEITTLEQAGTWETVLHPLGKNIIGSKWVFRIKRKADGMIDKYKARLVACGFTQIYGVDYFTTYSPVAKLMSFRTILAIAVCQNWDIKSFDFNSVYLNGELDANEDIYMQALPGYDSDAHTVKHLRKSLYSLKQAGRRWYDTLARALKSLGFSISIADPGVFIAHVGDEILILAVHVDNCILTGSSAKLIAEFKKKLNSCYALTDLGPVHWLLGIKVTCDCAAHDIPVTALVYQRHLILIRAVRCQSLWHTDDSGSHLFKARLADQSRQINAYEEHALSRSMMSLISVLVL
jgi:hypothetical protein